LVLQLLGEELASLALSDEFFSIDQSCGPVESSSESSTHQRAGGHLVAADVLTVYFGAPSMFITLCFGFDYGTNPPLGTLII
jgi:hypothetical protein